MGSEDSTLTPEKSTKSSSSSSSTGTTTNKHSSHTDSINPSSSKKISNNILYKHQGQKWQNIFDFDKILKHLRGAEKQLRHKKCEYFGTNNVCRGCNPETGNNTATKADSPPRAVKQVQRLDAKDMHYYGIVGNRSMLDIIVCNVCGGSYTKMGFNNHMMLQHPSVWSSISTKVDVSDIGTDSIRILPVTDMSAAAANPEVGPSSSGTISTTESTNSTNSRHKSKKTSSKSGSSSSSTGRSRSKSKHHSSSHSSSKHSTLEPKPVVETPFVSSTSKKSTKSAKKAVTPFNNTHTNTKDLKSIANASYAAVEASTISPLPTPLSTPTQRKATANTVEATTAEKAYSPGNVKDKLLTEKVLQTVSKKKSKSSSQSAQETHDLDIVQSVSTFERPTSTASIKIQKSTSSSATSKSSSSSSTSMSSAKTSSNSKKSKSEQKRGTTEITTQLSELDRAVSSITGSQEIKKELNAQMDDDKTSNVVNKSNKSVAAGAYRKPPLMVEVKNEKPTLNKSEPTVNYDALNSSASSGLAQTSSSPLNNAILTFDDILDNKFISEILGNADNEMNYNEHATTNDNNNRSVEQQVYNQNHPPASKRMRYDGHENSIMEQPTELNNEFAIFQQQQYTNYNTSGVIEDIKIFNNPQSDVALEGQYQPQIHLPTQILPNQDQMDTLENSQLQQLLYQQQNLNVYNENSNKREPNLQQSSYDQTNYCQNEGLSNTTKLMDMSNSTNDAKPQEYATLATINNSFSESLAHAPLVESQFQLYNVPSITDDASTVSQNRNVVVDNIRLRCDPQHFVLPQGNDEEQHLIYEITANNQVAVLSHVRHQQVITELLNQAAYENVEYMSLTGGATATPTSSGSDESSEWFDFDFSRIDTAKTIIAPSNSGNATQLRPARSEFANLTPLKFHEDFYMNVHVYTRIPRPLAINTFGLVKLPWSVAGAFRKQIISSRKANNSPITLSSCIGGPNALNVRGAKSSHNYFTALPTAGHGSNGCMNNEFSIGSITITNSQTSVNGSTPHSYKHTNQTNGHIEISFNTNSNSSVITAASNAALHSKMRPKISGMQQSPVGAISGTTTSIGAIRFSPNAMNVRTVYVQNGANVIENRESIVKRCVIANHSDVDDASKSKYFTAKQISDFLTSGNRTLESIQQQPTLDNPTFHESKCSIAHSKKILRMNNFYQQRKKLLNAMNSSQIPLMHQQQQQRLKHHTSKQTILKRLLKNHNCAQMIGHSGNTIATTTNSSTSNNGELTRVYM